MLLEALNFAATYTISPRKTASEINSSVNLWARARRCARAWAEHEAHSKDFVLKAIDQLPERRVAAVLGSGLLRDVPIEILSRSFHTVRLYDLQHLASVKLWAAAKGFKNLHFENRDLSGWEQLRNDPHSVPRPLAFLGDIADLDFVVSANLLSQIGIGIGRLVKAADSGMPVDTVPRLLRAHIDGLSTLAAKASLITDVSYTVMDKAGKVLESRDLTHGIALPAPQTEWKWTVAPFGELDPTYQALHRVVGVCIG